MRRISPILFLYLVAVAAFAETSIAALVVDDFERGSFYIEETGTVGETTVFIGEPAHCIAPDRRVVAYSNSSGQVIASLNVGLEADDKIVADYINGGQLSVAYEWELPVDLTEGGRNDQLAIYLTEVVPGASIILQAGGPSGAVTRMIETSEPGPYYFDLADIAVTATDATYLYISFNCSPGLKGRFIIADIRATYSPGHFTHFVGNFVATQTPPVPAPPLVFTLLDEVSQPLYGASAGIDYVENLGVVPQMSFDWNEVPFNDGEMAVMRLWWEESDPYDNAMFELSFDFLATDGASPAIVYPPDPIIGAHGMSISTGIQAEDPMGNPIGMSMVDISFNTGLFQDVVFENVVITQNRLGHSVDGADRNAGALETKGSGDSHRGIAQGFKVSFTLSGINVDLAEPLLEIAYVANAWPVTTSDVSTSPDHHGQFELSALPSVTRGTTLLRSSSPVGEDSHLEIYGPTGRKLRSWPVARGPLEVLWDGRDEQGALVPAGVYWARIRYVGGSATSRIVRVR